MILTLFTLIAGGTLGSIITAIAMRPDYERGTK